MRINTAHLQKIVIIFWILISACEKKESTKTIPKKDDPIVIVLPEEQKVLLPIKVKSEKQDITLSYLPVVGILTEIQSTNGTREVYTYNATNQLKTFERYLKGEKIYKLDYLLDAQGFVKQANQFKVGFSGAGITPIGIYKINYIEDHKIDKITWYNTGGDKVSELQRTYTTTGAPLKFIKTGLNSDTEDFIFDEKIGIGKNIKDIQILSIESSNSLFLCSVGNLLKSTKGSGTKLQTTYVYKYNVDNYPESWTQSDTEGKKESFVVTYK
jgi:hypothetical protein